MKYPWLFFVFSAIVAAIIVSLLIRSYVAKKRNQHRNISVLAHTKGVRDLPAYKSAKRRYIILLSVAALLLATTVFSFTGVAARPIEQKPRDNNKETRDIMLCLDTSGSMDKVIPAIIDYFKNISGKLNGERIGLTIFDSLPASVMPLTDDYLALSETLGDVQGNLNVYTLSFDRGLSNIGEGLMGCINSFDVIGKGRTQSIILATDNSENGPRKILIDEAAAYAKKNGITVYGIYIPSTFIKNYETEDEKLFRNAIGQSNFYKTDPDNDSVTIDIVEKIIAQESAKTEGAREYVRVDSPGIYLLVGCIAMLLLTVVLWRLHL